VKSPLVTISIVAVLAVVLVAGVYGLGILGSNNPAVTIVGISPLNHSLTANNKPAVDINLTTLNVKMDSLNFMLYIDGENATGAVTASPSSVQFNLLNELAEGIHHAQVIVSQGQATLASSSWDFNVDSSPPELNWINPGNSTVHPGDGLIVSANFTDPAGIDLGRLIFTLDGIEVTNASLKSNNGISYSPITTLSEGAHNFTLELCDAVGNNASYSWSVTIKYPVIDSYPPYLISSNPANGSFVNSQNPLVSCHINDTLSGVDMGSVVMRIDNIPVTFDYAGSPLDGWTVSYRPFLTNNNHTAAIYFEDYNNNSKTGQISFAVDSIPPAIDGITPSNGSYVNGSSVLISAQFSDLISGINASTVVLSIDSLYNPASAIINSSGVSYIAQLTNGSHSATIRVSDKAGNVARVSWSFSVNVQYNPPEPSGVIVLTKTGYFNTESGLPTIVGEVKNNGTTAVKNVFVEGLFMCKDGGVINNDKVPAILYGYAEIEVLEPGDVAPFKLEMPVDFPDFGYILTQLTKFDAKIENYTVTTDVPYSNYMFSNATGTLMPNNHYNLTGVITNTGATAISDIKVVGTFYTPTKPIAVESLHIYSLEPGESAIFTLLVEDNDVGPLITRYDLKGSA